MPVIRLSGGTPVFVSLRYPDYRVDWDEVKRAITPRTRAILVNTPHNPTGVAWTADDMRQLSALVDGTDILLIGDEVYEHVIFDGRRHESLLRYPELRSRACVISSFGKTFHTTGWKVGYCVAPQPILAEVQRVHQFMTFTVHTPSQFAFAEFVSRDPMAAELAAFYQRKRDLFLSLIDGSRFKPLACEGTYFQLLDYSAIALDTDREMAMRFITEHGVAVDSRAPRFSTRIPADRCCASVSPRRTRRCRRRQSDCAASDGAAVTRYKFNVRVEFELPVPKCDGASTAVREPGTVTCNS